MFLRTIEMKKLKVLVILLLVCFGLNAQVDSVYIGAPSDTTGQAVKKAKIEKWDKIKDKLTYGGNFQVWLNNPFFLFLSPTVGYAPIEKLNVGLGIIYNYTSADYGSYGRYTQSVFGVHSYVRYLVTDGVFVQVQYDKLRQPDFYAAEPNKKVWVDYVMIGGGFRQPLGDKVALTSAVMYNLTPSPLSIYGSSRLIIQFGIVAGF